MIDNDIRNILNESIKDKINEAFKNINNRVAIDYMCSQCHECFFYEHLNMGMEGTHDLCKILEPKDDFFKSHVMNWVSARDLDLYEDIKKFYYRKCPYYLSYKNVMREKLEEVKSKKGE